MTSLLTTNTQINHAEIAGYVTPFSRPFQAAEVLRFWNPFTASGQAALNDEITRQASLIAYIDDFKFLMVIALLALPMVLLLRKPARGAAQGPVVVD